VAFILMRRGKASPTLFLLLLRISLTIFVRFSIEPPNTAEAGAT